MKEMEYKNEKIFKILSHGEYKDIPYWVISFGTHPCAYIEVTKYKNFLGEGTQEWHRCDEIKIDCHGGVTYDEDYLNDVWDEAFDDFKPNARRFIGWDYAHARDYYEYHSQAMSMSLNSFENAHKWTTGEIVEEVKEVIDSLITSVAKAKKIETKSLTIDEDEMTTILTNALDIYISEVQIGKSYDASRRSQTKFIKKFIANLYSTWKSKIEKE